MHFYAKNCRLEVANPLFGGCQFTFWRVPIWHFGGCQLSWGVLHRKGVLPKKGDTLASPQIGWKQEEVQGRRWITSAGDVPGGTGSMHAPSAKLGEVGRSLANPMQHSQEPSLTFGGVPAKVPRIHQSSFR